MQSNSITMPFSPQNSFFGGQFGSNILLQPTVYIPVQQSSKLLLSRDHYLKRNVYKLLSLYPSFARVGKKGSGNG